MRRFITIGIALAGAAVCHGQVAGSAAVADLTEPRHDATDAVWATFDPAGTDDHDEGMKLDGADPANLDDGEDEGPGLGLRGGPANDFCSNATVIPGNIVTYNPPQLNTTGALITLCEAAETCEIGGVGTSNSVWYSYTPDADGQIELNTFGSNYNTVLSVFDGCGSGFPSCNQPNQLACADEAPFSQQSQLYLDVFAGQTYIIKVADYDTASGGGLLDFDLIYRPANDICDNALEIPGVVAYDPPLLSTHNAVTDLCEADESCEFNNAGVSNSVWYAYTPACDGLLSVNTNGSSYDTVLSIHDGCGEFVGVDFPCNLPAEMACDDDSGTGLDSQLIDVPVTGGQRYLIKVSDYNTTQGGGWLDFNLVFSGAAGPTVAINSPTLNQCICSSVQITGDAYASDNGPISYELEYRAVNAFNWTSIAASDVPANNSVLAVWNTAGLTQGNYLLRLTGISGCGQSDTAIQVVHVDGQFDNLELRAPTPGQVLGGKICLDGSAYDNYCFDHYTAEWTPLAGGSPAPIEPANPIYTNGVVNDPLGQWDTIAGGVPDGDYMLDVIGTTQCGNSAAEGVRIVVDNTWPTAVLDTPVQCELVGDEIVINGTADDANLQSWVLQYTGGPSNGWTTLASGNTPVINDTLAVWDTSNLPYCAYTLRLIVTDLAAVDCNPAIRHQSEALASVIKDAPLCPGDVDGDGDVDLSDLAILIAAYGTSCF